MPFLDAEPPIHYVLSGREGAPAVVLSHSLGASLAMWDRQLPELERRFRVVRYDVRGHGHTPATPAPYDLDGLGGDLVRLLDGLGLDRVHFCGLSLGGLLGMWLAARHGPRVDRLALCNTAARIGSAESWTTRMDAVRAGGLGSVVDGILERWFSPGFRGRDPEAVTRARAMLEATSREGYLGCCAALRDADERDGLPAIAAPTLVVVGRDDAATSPAQGRALAAAIPGARYVELPAAHLSNIEAADAFTAELAGFLA